MKLGYLQPFIEYLRPSFAIFTFSIFTFSRTIPSKQPIPSKRPIANVFPFSRTIPSEMARPRLRPRPNTIADTNTLSKPEMVRLRLNTIADKLLPLPVDIDVLVNGFVNVDKNDISDFVNDVNDLDNVNHFVNDFVSNFVNDINDVKIKILPDTAMKLMEKWDVELFVNTITITKFKYLQPLLGFKFKFLTAMKLMER